MEKIPGDNSKLNNNNNNNFQEKKSLEIESDLPSEEELYKNYNNINFNLYNNININQENNIYENNTDENININLPRNNLYPFSQPRINNNININSINTNDFNFNNFNYNNNNNFNDINMNPFNQVSRVNSRSQSYLDQNGNIIYRNPSNRIISRNSNNDLELVKLDSHRIKVGNNEFEDLTKEARELQNKEAFEKKILGLTQGSIPNSKQQESENKSFFEKIGDFFSDHEEGIYAVLDGIGCILLHGPSIGRTIDRIDKWIDGWGDKERENINNLENISSQQRSIILEKNKDYATIMKFLPIWQIRENKKSDNNNNCVICLYEFQIGDNISALPCLHVFHHDCIKNWLKNELTCPVCKLEITLSSIIGENNN